MTLDRWMQRIPLRLRSVFRRSVVDRELDDEFQYHIERQTAEYIRRGMAPAAALEAARRELGNIAFYKEEARDTRGTRWIEELLGDVRFGMRSLRRAPVFSVAVVATLALGIGANTAMFTLLRGTLLKPLPNRDGERIVYIRQSAPGSKSRTRSSPFPRSSTCVPARKRWRRSPTFLRSNVLDRRCGRPPDAHQRRGGQRQLLRRHGTQARRSGG